MELLVKPEILTSYVYGTSGYNDELYHLYGETDLVTEIRKPD
jgi:hypothetical protein